MKEQIINYVPKSVTRGISRKILTTKKQSPHIFFVGGILGLVTSTVLACRATLKLSETLDEIQEDVDTINELKHSSSHSQYVVEEWHRDAAYVYVRSTLKIVKLYGVPVLIGSVSIAALTGSHIQMTRRNTALMAAYAAVAKAYEEYRERVREEVGESRELDLYRNIRTEEFKDEENDTQIVRVGSGRGSPYAVFFDAGSSHWNKNPELNRLFIQCQENYANKLLNVRGHVFLNEIYDRLDVERTPAGAMVGWVKDGNGDNYIDFGMYDTLNSDFLVGLERVVILDFNVDGIIYDKI